MEVEPSVQVVPQNDYAPSSTSSTSTTNAGSTASKAPTTTAPKKPTGKLQKKDIQLWKALQKRDDLSALALVKQGTRLDMQDKIGETVISLCFKNQLYNFLGTILTDKACRERVEPLIIHIIRTAHVLKNNVNYMEKLIDLGLDVNNSKNPKETFLTIALEAYQMHPTDQTFAIIELLINAGALGLSESFSLCKMDPEILFKKVVEKYKETKNEKLLHLTEEILKTGMPIAEYVKTNQITQVKWLIEHGAQLNHPANIKLLHSAALRDLHEMVDVLIKAGIDPTKTDSDDRTALYGAVLYGHVAMVQKLLKLGVAPYKKGSLEESLITAVQNNNTEEVHALLEGQAQNAQRRAEPDLITEKGEHILSIALKNKNVEIIMDLLQHKCSLYYLVTMNDVEAIDTILALKAELIDANLAQEATELLHFVARKNSVDMVRVLLYYDASIESVVFDQQQNLKADYKTLELLLQAEVIKTSNATNRNGNTINEALKKAVYTKGDFEIVALLLTYGASIQSVLFDDKNNFIATEKALILLLEAGAANISPANKNTLSNVLQLATAGKNTQIIALLEGHGITNQNTQKNRALSQELIRNGASETHIETSLGTIESLTSSTTQHPELVNAKDEQKNTPLHYAAQRNTIGLIRDIKTSKLADEKEKLAEQEKFDKEIEAAEEASKNALEKQTKEAIELLVRAGANINAKNKNGDTPLLLAVKQSNMAAIKTLLALRAKPFIANNMDETPLSIAQLYRHEDILTLLHPQKTCDCCVITRTE
jgi:ankyrin repeat protein